MFEKLMLKLYGPDWKSSLNGDLSLLKSAATTATPFLVVMPQTRWVAAATAVCAILTGSGQAMLGRKMKDAGTVLAVLPNNSTPQAVPSTEVPLNPEAEVITPKTK